MVDLLHRTVPLRKVVLEDSNNFAMVTVAREWLYSCHKFCQPADPSIVCNLTVDIRA